MGSQLRQTTGYLNRQKKLSQLCACLQVLEHNSTQEVSEPRYLMSMMPLRVIHEK